MKSVVEYDDYRRFLRDYYQERKRTQSGGYSYERFAQDAGAKSPNFFQLVIEGKRNLTLETLHRTADALGLEGVERDSFEWLVNENQTEDKGLQTRLRARRRALRTSLPAMESAALPAGLRKWYQPAVALLALGLDEAGAVRHVSRALGISAEAVREALRALLLDGVLRTEHTPQKITFQLKAQTQTYSDPRSLAVAQQLFLKEQLEQSVKAFATDYPRGTSKFLGETLLAPAGSERLILERLKQEIFRLVAEIDAQNPPATVPVQVNLQIFEARQRK